MDSYAGNSTTNSTQTAITAIERLLAAAHFFGFAEMTTIEGALSWRSLQDGYQRQMGTRGTEV